MITATKEEERKALQKIRTIIKSLGEDSYIGTAFTGAFELAEQNIDNDWALSTQEYIEMANEADGRVRDAKNESARLKTENESFAETNRELHDRYKAEFNRAETNEKLIVQYDADKRQLTADLEATRKEIVLLKARLYDYLIQSA